MSAHGLSKMTAMLTLPMQLLAVLSPTLTRMPLIVRSRHVAEDEAEPSSRACTVIRSATLWVIDASERARRARTVGMVTTRLDPLPTELFDVALQKHR